jgi:hypothetical protein
MRPCPIFKNISIRVLGFGVIPEKLTWLLTILLNTLPRQIDIMIVDDISKTDNAILSILDNGFSRDMR